MSSSNRATLAQSPTPSSPSFKSKRKSWARKCERCCCNCIIYFPLVIVYGLTSWAVWVQATIGLVPSNGTWTSRLLALLGILFFLLLNWSYTTAVFTDPGSPLTQITSAYSIVPSADEDEEQQQQQQSVEPQQDPNHPLPPSLTVKSTGEARYCKKCHTNKPDRTHHCSTCRRCVLKMDHHCPWLATCVGFRNYKPFLLFLIYTCFFCWLCFAVSAYWVWKEVIGETGVDKTEQLMPVNIIILAVLAGVIGLVLAGFTGWHIYLAMTGQTTIESLEKTRYLGPLRKSMQGQHHQNQNPIRLSDRPALSDDDDRSDSRRSFASQLREIHANAIPGVTRPEEGVPSPSLEPITISNDNSSPYKYANTSPAQNSLRKNISRSPIPSELPPYRPNYSSPYDPTQEAFRERARYNAYLDELDTAKLPNAFHLGWRRNLIHVFGPTPSLWFLPICNTTGDGWTWEPSKRWVEAQEQLARERKARAREDAAFARERWETMQGGTRSFPPAPLSDSGSHNADATHREYNNSPFNSSNRNRSHQPSPRQEWGREAATLNWNDIPDEYLAPSEAQTKRFRNE